jgi:hypothetical protein
MPATIVPEARERWRIVVAEIGHNGCDLNSADRVEVVAEGMGA